MFQKILIGIVLNGLALYAVTRFLTEVQYTGGIKFFIVAAFIIGVLNTFVKPLMKILSFPVVVLTAGLFSFVINIIIFWLTVKIVNGIHIPDVTMMVTGVVTYVIAAFVFGLVNWVLHIFVPNKK